MAWWCMVPNIGFDNSELKITTSKFMVSTYTKKNSDGLKLHKTKCKTRFKHEIKKKTEL